MGDAESTNEQNGAQDGPVRLDYDGMFVGVSRAGAVSLSRCADPFSIPGGLAPSQICARTRANT